MNAVLYTAGEQGFAFEPFKDAHAQNLPKPNRVGNIKKGGHN